MNKFVPNEQPKGDAGEEELHEMTRGGTLVRNPAQTGSHSLSVC